MVLFISVTGEGKSEINYKKKKKKISSFLFPMIKRAEKVSSGTPSTKNIPHLHGLGPQFCMYEKHFFRTHTREAILHVHIWRWEFGFGFDCTQNSRNNQRLV